METLLPTCAVVAVLLLTQGSEGIAPRRLDPLPSPPPGVGVVRDVSLDDRYNCTAGDGQPPNRVDTTERVARLRQEMANYGLDAYLILTDDEHQNEFVSPEDKRLQYVSGFSGSWGVVAVTMMEQAVWVDSRYFLQADNQLDCRWLLMKTGLPGVPSPAAWLRKALREGARVSSDPRIMTATSWMSYASSLAEAKIEMVTLNNNLVDITWTDRPPHAPDPASVLPLQFAGVAWQDKVRQARAAMVGQGASMVVLSALDEVAWLLNLRGNDIPYNPVFRGYVLLGLERVQLFTPEDKVTLEVEDHLNAHHCASSLCVEILEYEAIEDSIKALMDDPSVSSVLINPSASSYSIYNAIPATKRAEGPSPIVTLKATKNLVEMQGMRNAHLKDAVALCDFLALLEKEVSMEGHWDELSAANASQAFRRQQHHYVQPSFGTISGFGPNGAIIHYEPSPETNLPLDTSSLYLLDSGAQFMDGTTDVTRTVHFGTPTAQQVRAYTRVLQGQMEFASIVFPAGTSLSDIEILARRYLYEDGLDYPHGTSHGVGMFLYVHEATRPAFGIGEFVSDEPGFYVDGEYGIRLENVVEVVEFVTPYNFSGTSMTFKETTLVPYEPKLIDTTILTQQQCGLLNGYHARVREEVGQEMVVQGLLQGYAWLLSKTESLC